MKQDGYALRYVKEQTPEICLKAVERSSGAIYYVKDRAIWEECADMLGIEYEKK
ncbi:MAG: hypothetical protein ACTSQ8_23715 [Candidatus Helarchaeota archaeon]